MDGVTILSLYHHAYHTDCSIVAPRDDKATIKVESDVRGILEFLGKSAEVWHFKSGANLNIIPSKPDAIVVWSCHRIVLLVFFKPLSSAK